MNIHKVLQAGQFAYRHKLRLLTKLLRMHERILYTCDIPFQANIDSSVHFDHNGFGTVISPYAVIGSHTDIQHGVTIGVRAGGELAPTIGSHVIIGAKATLLWKYSRGRPCEDRRWCIGVV